VKTKKNEMGQELEATAFVQPPGVKPLLPKDRSWVKCALMRTLLTFAFFALALSSPVFGASGTTDGNDILRECGPRLDKADPTELETTKYIHCMGYMAGVMDTAVFMQTMFKQENTVWRWCGPSDGIEGVQAARVVIKWLKNNPEKLHLRGD